MKPVVGALSAAHVSISEKSPDVRPRRWVLPAILTLALAVRLLALAIAPHHNFIGDETEYNGIAAMLNAGQGWQWFAGGGAVWVRPPLYPLFLLALYKAFGPNLVAFQLVQILLSVATVYLLYCLAARLYGRAVGLWAAGLLAVAWPFVVFPTFLLSENLFLFLLVASFYALTHILKSQIVLVEQGTQPGWWRWSPQLWAMGGGALLGLAALTRGQIVSFLPFVLLWPAFVLAGNVRQRARTLLRFSPLIVIAFVLVISPWLARNAATYGRPFIDTTGGYNFYLGAVGAAQELRVNQTLLEEPNQSARESLAYSKGLAKVQADPVGFVGKGIKEFGDFWRLNFGADENLYGGYSHGDVPVLWLSLGLVLGDVLYLVAGALGVLGLLLAPERNGGRWLVGLWTLQNMALAFIFFATSRFRLATFFLLLIFAAWTIANRGKVWQKLKSLNPTGASQSLLKRGGLYIPFVLALAFAVLVGASFIDSSLPNYVTGFSQVPAHDALVRAESQRLAGQPQTALDTLAQADQNDPATFISRALAYTQLSRLAPALDQLHNPVATRSNLSNAVVGFIARLQSNTTDERSAFNNRSLVSSDAGANPPDDLHWAWQAAAPVLGLKSTITLDGISDWGYIDNFHASERDGTQPFRWTAGPGMERPQMPRIRLRLAANATPQMLTITVRGGQPSTAMLEVWVNGQRLATAQTRATWQTLAFTLPPGIVASAPLNSPANAAAQPANQSRDLIIELRSPVFVVNNSLSDRRELGVAISSVSVK